MKFLRAILIVMLSASLTFSDGDVKIETKNEAEKM
jgi:hypothetical protein